MQRQVRGSEPEKPILPEDSERITEDESVRLAAARANKVAAILSAAILLTAAAFLNPLAAIAGDLKGKVVISGGAGNANAVVYVENVDSVFDPPREPAVMDQKHLAFIPEVLPVLAGTTVRFMNSDEVLHDVFTPTACAGGFDLGTFPPGESKSHLFDKPGCFALILCDVHPEMQAWIAVLQNPYFALSDRLGNYVIRGVPAGTYVLKAWFGYYKSQSVKVNVPASGSVKVDFKLEQ